MKGLAFDSEHLKLYKEEREDGRSTSASKKKRANEIRIERRKRLHEALYGQAIGRDDASDEAIDGDGDDDSDDDGSSGFIGVSVLKLLCPALFCSRVPFSVLCRVYSHGICLKISYLIPPHEHFCRQFPEGPASSKETRAR